MELPSLGTVRTYLDKGLDYIPGLSLLSNLVDVVEKTCIIIYEKYGYKGEGAYYDHLKSKSFSKCCLLAIPVANVVGAVYRDHMASKRSKYTDCSTTIHLSIVEKRGFFETGIDFPKQGGRIVKEEEFTSEGRMIRLYNDEEMLKADFCIPNKWAYVPLEHMSVQEDADGKVKLVVFDRTTYRQIGSVLKPSDKLLASLSDMPEADRVSLEGTVPIESEDDIKDLHIEERSMSSDTQNKEIIVSNDKTRTRLRFIVPKDVVVSMNKDDLRKFGLDKSKPKVLRINLNLLKKEVYKQIKYSEYIISDNSYVFNNFKKNKENRYRFSSEELYVDGVITIRVIIIDLTEKCKYYADVVPIDPTISLDKIKVGFNSEQVLTISFDN